MKQLLIAILLSALVLASSRALGKLNVAKKTSNEINIFKIKIRTIPTMKTTMTTQPKRTTRPPPYLVAFWEAWSATLSAKR
jgi:hypothetical protein